MFCGLFSACEDYFSPYSESFSGMSTLTKIAESAHAFAAIVVASVAHSGNLREIARLNIFVNTFYSTFSRNAGKTNEMIRC